jgi:hypothetical protein
MFSRFGCTSDPQTPGKFLSADLPLTSAAHPEDLDECEEFMETGIGRCGHRDGGEEGLELLPHLTAVRQWPHERRGRPWRHLGEQILQRWTKASGRKAARHEY